MLDRRILSLVELSCDGVTNSQLLWRLNAGGTRYDASDLLSALDRLSQSGEIRSDGARWRARSISGIGKDLDTARIGTRRTDSTTGSDATLASAPATLGSAPSIETTGLIDATVEQTSGPDPASLLRYYAATQRRDPRGSVEAFIDGHGASWQLFDAHGTWWDGRTVQIGAAMLQPGFRQALAAAGSRGTAAIGWPIAVFDDSTGKLCLPVLLLPVDWYLQDDVLQFSADRVSPVLNPAVIRHLRRSTGLRDEALERVFDSSENGAELDEIGRRLAHLLARIGGGGLRPAELDSQMWVTGEGVRNVAALFLPDENSFTRRLAEDLDSLAEWPDDRRKATALSDLLDSSGQRPTAERAADVVELSPLSDRQFRAADAALSSRITAIQGPPGTGKSQTIVSIIVSAIAAGQTVLFAARNHRALDEVEHRLARLMPGVPLAVRARDADGERDTSLWDMLCMLADGQMADTEAATAISDRRAILSSAARGQSNLRRRETENEALRLLLADLIEREEDLATTFENVGAKSRYRVGLWQRILAAISRKRAGDPFSPIDSSTRPEELRARISQLRDRLASLPVVSDVPSIDAERQIAALAQALVLPEPTTVEHLRAQRSEIEFQPGRAKLRHISQTDARLILNHRPVWMASTLSVPSRIPLFPALFDLAIFDEASQCDIASALPILARARRAVIVGDPEQLSFIPGLGLSQEHALMDAANLPKLGRGAWAQSRNSLFDFARNRLPAESVYLLPDQFRSAPDIVSYTSDAFYGGRLKARRDDGDFAPPSGYRAGLHWEDIKGRSTREDGGNINREQAQWIAARIGQLATDASFEGSVGVVSPFNAQVGLIRALTERNIAPDVRRRLALNIDTVDGWQGGEADIIFFSLAVGPGAAQSAISFLQKERRRFNVAVSRARAVAVVVGDLDWARDCGIAHIELLADRATRPPGSPKRGFDSKWERRVHEALLRRGLEPIPQYQEGRRSLDFALFEGEIKLDLEVDGRKWHTGAGGERKVSDRLRDRELLARNWRVRRFWVDELAKDMEGCIDIVERDLGRRG